MENEYYNVDLEFIVQETEANFNKGHLYVSSMFTSYKPEEKPLMYQRMGSIKHKASFIQYIKMFMSYIPFITYFCSCEP